MSRSGARRCDVERFLPVARGQHAKAGVAQLQRHHVQDVRFVVGDQDRSFSLIVSPLLLQQVQFKAETAALARLAFDEDASAVNGFDDVLHERQAPAPCLCAMPLLDSTL